MSITREVKNLILQFPKNQLFSSSEVYMKYFTEFCTESSFFKIIIRMQKEGSIIIIQKGIFYLPKYKEVVKASPLGSITSNLSFSRIIMMACSQVKAYISN
jgi:hypothetical protein